MRHKLLFLAIIYFPGTVIHEMAHFLTAKILRVPTGRVSLFPRFTEHGLQLGSVEIGRTDIFRRFLVGVAPLIVGILLLLVTFYLTANYTLPWWGYLLSGYCIVTVANTMNLSKSDLRGSKYVLLFIVVLLALYWVFTKGYI